MTGQLYDVAISNIIQAADVDQCVDMINTLLGYTNGITINGSTTGTATLYEILQGPVKMVVVSMSNFRNGSASGTIALPTAFTKGCIAKNSGCGTFRLLSAGANVTVQIHTGFASTSADGGVSPGTDIHQNNEWHSDSPFDSLYFFGSDVATHNGFIMLVGS